VRSTLTIDDDIAALVEAEVRRSGKPYKVVVNELLKLGLAEMRRPQARRAFKVKPRALGLPPGGNYDKISTLLEELEGPNHK
jgi:hypothetical protein